MTKKLSLEQLYRHGLPVGSITATTRPIDEKKLNKRLHLDHYQIHYHSILGRGRVCCYYYCPV
jgi:hypothetical protein